MEKIYIGNGKQLETKFGSMLKLSFSKKDLETMLENINEKGYININVNERKDIGKYGETHYMVVDNWKPTGEKHQASQEEININEIPF